MSHDIPTSKINWQPSYRIIPSRYPPVALFDRVAKPEDLEIILAIESLTNDRLLDEIGVLSLVAKEDRIAGPGTTPIMTAFTHLNPNGSRFTDGTYGVYYASADEKTALVETRYHSERFMRFSNETPMHLMMCAYVADINEKFHDIRGMQKTQPQWYQKADYSQSQRLGLTLRNEGSNGIIYNSVRNPGGECIGAFRPRVIQPAKQGPHYEYIWDGTKVCDILIVNKIL